MEFKKCILTGEDITAANDSRGHVIPSSLGGRLKPKGLVAKEANTTFNDRLDAPMVRALTPFMAPLGGSRDGGTTAPIEMTDADGVAYRVSAGKPMTLARPGYDETPLGEGTRIEIRARTMPEARQLLQRAKSTFPQVDVDAAMNHAKMEAVTCRTCSTTRSSSDQIGFFQGPLVLPTSMRHTLASRRIPSSGPMWRQSRPGPVPPATTFQCRCLLTPSTGFRGSYRS